MFGTTWQTSPREHEVIHERTHIAMPDGVRLTAQIWRPDAAGTFPAVLGYHPYASEAQTAPITPSAISAVAHFNPGQEGGNGWIEAGDPNFYARRGYVYVLVNVRGTGESEGVYQYLSHQEAQDGYDVVEWIAAQTWCDGGVGMFGVSYFARIQYFVAATQPPHLKCLFAPWASSDQYRDVFYQGGILSKDWPIYWGRSSLRNTRYESPVVGGLTDEELQERLAPLRADPDIAQDPELAAVLADPHRPTHRFILDVLLNDRYTDFWQQRTFDYEKIQVPVYLGGDWANYGLHLPGAFRTWAALSHVPRRMIVGPTAYLDRPLSQLQYESLRWYDTWLKGMDVGLDQDPPISVFVMGTGRWKESTDWPLPETRWTPFYLHEKGRLWEREHFPYEGSSSYSDSPWGREFLEFSTSPLVEETEVIGPMLLRLYASTTDEEVLWFVSVRQIDPDGVESILTRGWLRGTHRAVDEAAGKPWLPYHPHQERLPIVPGKVERYDIPIVPTANLFRPGSRLKIKIAGVDDESTNSLQAIAGGHIRRRLPSRVTVFHNQEFPSELLVPVTSGNLLGTFLSGGGPYTGYQ
jgi:predicted acyl esterase